MDSFVARSRELGRSGRVLGGVSFPGARRELGGSGFGGGFASLGAGRADDGHGGPVDGGARAELGTRLLASGHFVRRLQELEAQIGGVLPERRMVHRLRRRRVGVVQRLPGISLPALQELRLLLVVPVVEGAVGGASEGRGQRPLPVRGREENVPGGRTGPGTCPK